MSKGTLRTYFPYIQAIPENLQDSFAILDTVLTEGEKAVIKCVSESTLLTRQLVSPVFGWINNQFKVNNEDYPLGKIFKDKGVAGHNGDVFILVPYKRRLEQKELRTEELFTAFRIRNETSGRIKSIGLYNKLSKQEIEQIITWRMRWIH